MIKYKISIKAMIAVFVMLLLGSVIAIMLYKPMPTENATIITTLLTLLAREFGTIVRSNYKALDGGTETETPTQTLNGSNR